MGTLVSIRGRSSGSSVMSATKPSAPPWARSSISSVPRAKPGSSSWLLAHHGCPLQAVAWLLGLTSGRSPRGGPVPVDRGRPCTEVLVEQPRDLGQVQADELRVKKQSGIVWMALAMMVKTRLWLGGEVSAQRDMPLIRRLSKRVRRCAAKPLLICTDGLVSYIRAMQETFRDPVHMGHGRTATASCVAPCLDRPSRQTLRAAACGRDRTPHCRWHAGTRGDPPASVARRRHDQYSVH